jgi:hypothetical protein
VDCTGPDQDFFPPSPPMSGGVLGGFCVFLCVRRVPLNRGDAEKVPAPIEGRGSKARFSRLGDVLMDGNYVNVNDEMRGSRIGPVGA